MTGRALRWRCASGTPSNPPRHHKANQQLLFEVKIHLEVASHQATACHSLALPCQTLYPCSFLFHPDFQGVAYPVSVHIQAQPLHPSLPCSQYWHIIGLLAIGHACRLIRSSCRILGQSRAQGQRVSCQDSFLHPQPSIPGFHAPCNISPPVPARNCTAPPAMASASLRR